MTTQEVKIDAVQGVLEYVSDPDRPLDERLALLCGLVKVHVAKIAGLQDDLAQEQLLNAANTTTIAWLKEAFLEARALGCKAAWALGMTDVVGFTKRSTPTEELPGHTHELFTEEQLAALRPLAALDTSGYAPPDSDGGPNREVMGFSVGPTPEDAGTLIPGTGTGEPPVPPQYSSRPGAMHQGRSGLPPLSGARPS